MTTLSESQDASLIADGMIVIGLVIILLAIIFMLLPSQAATAYVPSSTGKTARAVPVG